MNLGEDTAVLGEAPRPFLWKSLGQDWRGTVTLAVRTEGDSRALLSAIRAEVRRLDPRVPATHYRTLTEALGAALFLPRLAAGLLGAFGAFGLLLAALGIYGGDRSFRERPKARDRPADGLGREPGRSDRLAPAPRARSGRLGVGGRSRRRFRGRPCATRDPHGIAPTDPATFLAVALLFAAVGLTASLLPARRAARLDPAVALRAE